MMEILTDRAFLTLLVIVFGPVFAVCAITALLERKPR